LSIAVGSSSAGVTEVEAQMPNGNRLRFQPRALTLAAGAGNAALLDLASGGRRDFLRNVSGQQQIRKSHMLVVKGAFRRARRDRAAGSLEPLTGVFSMGGLFIVSRQLGDSTVWLISDNRGPTIGFIEDWMAYDKRWWLARVWASLREIAPACFSDPKQFEWGLYAAPKAEGRAAGDIPHEERVESFGLSNLWVVWPTKLTLAPQASRCVVDEIQQRLGPPSQKPYPQIWRANRVFPGVAPERWVKTPLAKWDVFSKAYNI